MSFLSPIKTLTSIPKPDDGSTQNLLPDSQDLGTIILSGISDLDDTSLNLLSDSDNDFAF